MALQGNGAKALSSRSFVWIAVWGCVGWEGPCNHGFTVLKITWILGKMAHVADSIMRSYKEIGKTSTFIVLVILFCMFSIY